MRVETTVIHVTCDYCGATELEPIQEIHYYNISASNVLVGHVDLHNACYERMKHTFDVLLKHTTLHLSLCNEDEHV